MNILPSNESIDSTKQKVGHLFDDLYKQYKGEKYQEKIAAVAEAIQRLNEIPPENPQSSADLKMVTDLLDELIRKNKQLTFKELLFKMYHLIELLMMIL